MCSKKREKTSREHATLMKHEGGLVGPSSCTHALKETKRGTRVHSKEMKESSFGPSRPQGVLMYSRGKVKHTISC